MQVIKKFLSQLVSVDESRKSITVIILIVITAFSLYIAKTTNDIPSNCMTVILALSGFVWGLNTINGIANIITQKNNSQQSNYIHEESNIDLNDNNPVI